MDNVLTRDQLNAIIKLLPQTMDSDEIIALICTIVDLYGMQGVWGETAEEVGRRLALAEVRNATIN